MESNHLANQGRPWVPRNSRSDSKWRVIIQMGYNHLQNKLASMGNNHIFFTFLGQEKDRRQNSKIGIKNHLHFGRQDNSVTKYHKNPFYNFYHFIPYSDYKWRYENMTSRGKETTMLTTIVKKWALAIIQNENSLTKELYEQETKTILHRAMLKIWNWAQKSHWPRTISRFY